MALSARIPSGLDTNTFIPKMYSRNVLMALKSKLVVVPLVNHSYEPELVKGNIIYITQSQVGTATEVTVGTEGVQSDPTTTGITLTINQWFEAPYTVDYMSRRQSHIDIVGVAETESAYSLKKKIDTSLCDLFSGLATTVRGTDGSAWTDEVMIAAVEEVDEADVDEEGRSWVGDPSTRADIMNIDKFTKADYFAGEAVPTGQFRKDIYGAPLYITNNLTVDASAGGGSYGAYMRGVDAFAIVIQEDLDVDRVEQPLKHQIVINTSALWGVKALRDLAGVAIYTRLA